MWYVIDASQRDVVHFWQSSGGDWSMNTFSIQHSLEILPIFAAYRTSHEVGDVPLQGIGVVQGAGSFTSSRVVAVIANTLAFALGVPVIALPGLPTQPPAVLFAQATASDYVLPTYSAPASIGALRPTRV